MPENSSHEAQKFPLFWALMVVFSGFLTDRLHKYMLLNVLGMQQGDVREVTSFFNLTLVWNPGISYGFLSQFGENGRFFIIGFSFLAMALIVWFMIKEQSKTFIIGLSLVLSGALSNVTDRFLYGAVADFFHFHAFGYNWYIFNLADAWITIGVLIVILKSFFGRNAVTIKSDKD